MKHWRRAQIAVSAVVVCAAGAAAAAAEQQKQTPRTLPVAKVAAERTVAVYDAPGGESRIGYLAPSDKYFVAETRSLSARNAWHMLIAPGGAFVGWVRAWDGLDVMLCPRALPPIEIPLGSVVKRRISP